MRKVRSEIARLILAWVATPATAHGGKRAGISCGRAGMFSEWMPTTVPFISPMSPQIYTVCRSWQVQLFLEQTSLRINQQFRFKTQGSRISAGTFPVLPVMRPEPK
jgi:hypothetical protein